ncbi:MAG: hypothetical protein JWO13_1224 [Acidobacteriales bacterium]|nr:hypothetical protein [Terriglobales bacterium]
MAVHETHAAPRTVTPEQLTPPWVVDHLRKRWMGIAGLATILSFALYLYYSGTFEGRQQFFRAYLVGYIFCFGLMLGSTALLMLQHVTGGKWGLVLRRQLEAGTRTLPIVVLLFIPIIFGMQYLYPWAGSMPLDIHGQHALNVRADYLNAKWFVGRAAIYFVIWGIFIYLLNKWSLKQDVLPESPEAYNDLRLRFMRLGGGGLVVYAVTVSLAAIDWVMTLDPVWYSTIWGMLYMAGQALSTMAFMLVVLTLLAKYEPMKSLLRKTELHDNGKLLLAFVMLYAYLSFSQFIIIWSGNLPEEITWYLARTQHGWKPVMLLLVVIHFVIPFLLLLNRDLKKNPTRLRNVAILILFARVGEIFWQVNPNFKETSGITGHFNPNIMDMVLPIALAAIWITAFFYQLKKRPLLPAYHHLVPEILEPSHGAH